MSKNNNVNPGQYKVAGRERQGEDVVHERQKQELAKNLEKARGRRDRKKSLVPQVSQAKRPGP